MPITVIQPQEMSAYLENPNGYCLGCSPKKALLLESLAQELKKRGPQLPGLKVTAAYHCDGEAELSELFGQMKANGDFVPMQEGVSDAPRANPEDVEKLVSRAKGNEQTPGNDLIFVYILQYGLPYYQGGVDMFNELGNWYDECRNPKPGQEPPLIGRTRGIVRRYVSKLYHDNQPLYSSSSVEGSQRVLWIAGANNAVAVGDNLDSTVDEVIDWGGAVAKQEELSGVWDAPERFYSVRPWFRWKVLKRIQGAKALGLIPPDFGAAEEAQFKAEGNDLTGVV